MRQFDCIWLWFGDMARLAFLNLAAFVLVAASADETTNYRLEQQSNDPNIFGVSSVAQITSRNGRISSSGGVQFYPGPVLTNSDYNHPGTFTKAINGKYATGSVQIHPGALGVSSSAQAGYIDPGSNWPMDWPRQWNWPVQSQFYALEDPWANRSNRVKLPQASGRRQWLYPSFNPFFNFWR